ATGLWRPPFDGEEREWFERTIEAIRQRYFTLQDFSNLGRAYLSDEFPFDEAAVQKNLRKEPRLNGLLPALADRMESVEPFTAENCEAALRALAAEAGVKDGVLINAARTALTGQSVGPSMFQIFELLGRDRATRRLREAVALVQ